MASKNSSEEHNYYFKKSETEDPNFQELPVDLSPEDSRRLLQEIQLKEIELEFRYEQLLKENLELEKKADFYASSFHHSPQAFIAIRRDGSISDVNTAAARLLNYSTEALKHKKLANLIQPGFEGIVEAFLADINSGVQYQTNYLFFRTAEGEDFPAKIEISAPPGRHDIFITVHPEEKPFKIENITQHEYLYRAIGESINYGIWVCTPDGKNIYASESFLKLVGLTQEQCSNFGWGDVLHPDDRERTLQAWEQCVKTGGVWDIEHRYKGVDNRYHHILAKGVPVRNNNNEIIYWAGINLDIDKQKQTENQLKESENNFKYAERIAHLGSFQHNLKTGECKWSDEFYRICGFEPKSFPASTEAFISVFHPEDQNFVKEQINEAIENKTRYKHEGRILRPSGEIRHIISVGQIITGDDNKAVEIKGALQDVTDLKNIQLSLRASEDKYRVLFESMPIGLVISDTSGKLIYGNKKSRTLLGVSRTELKQGIIDITRWKFVYKEGSEILLTELPNLSNIHERRVIENKEIGIVRKNRITWFNVTAAPMQTTNEILIAFIDITEKVERENQLKLLSEKLKELNATKDKFFSIIAHDLKNPFNSILGFSELLLKNLAKYNSTEIERFVGIINSTSQNAYNLLENLLNWSRSQTGTIDFNPHLYNLNDLISTNIEFVKNLAVKKSIRIYFESVGKHMVEIDKNMIDTVLRNILTNSIKFSYPGGRIDIKIDPVDNFYKVSVKDNGIGIEEENIDKLFRIDSKYSSYGTSQEKGSGLGLIISKEFIEKNKGKIWATSEFGKGSEFFFTLPKQDTAKTDNQ